MQEAVAVVWEVATGVAGVGGDGWLGLDCFPDFFFLFSCFSSYPVLSFFSLEPISLFMTHHSNCYQLANDTSPSGPLVSSFPSRFRLRGHLSVR